METSVQTLGWVKIFGIFQNIKGQRSTDFDMFSNKIRSGMAWTVINLKG